MVTSTVNTAEFKKRSFSFVCRNEAVTPSIFPRHFSKIFSHHAKYSTCIESCRESESQHRRSQTRVPLSLASCIFMFIFQARIIPGQC